MTTEALPRILKHQVHQDGVFDQILDEEQRTRRAIEDIPCPTLHDLILVVSAKNIENHIFTSVRLTGREFRCLYKATADAMFDCQQAAQLTFPYAENTENVCTPHIKR